MPESTFLSDSPEILAIYRAVMERLEPDLLPENVDTLNEKYKNETPAEQEQRKDRYRIALTEAFRAVDEELEKMEQDVGNFQKAVVQFAEKRDVAIDAASMESIDQSIQDS